MTSLKATPKGREVLDRATTHVPALEAAIKYRTELQNCIDIFGKAVEDLPSSGSELKGLHFETLASAFSSLVLTFKETEHNSLFTDAEVKADQNKVRAHADKMLAKVFDACLEILKPLLVAEVVSIIDSNNVASLFNHCSFVFLRFKYIHARSMPRL